MLSSPSSANPLLSLHRLSWTALAAALISAGAFFYIPLGPVPITLQDFFVAISGFVLGARYGAFAVLLYIAGGIVGLPVFSGGRSGLGHILGPTGGYLAGFVFLAFFTGFAGQVILRMEKKHSFGREARKTAILAGQIGIGLLLSLAGLGLMYLCGAARFAAVMNVSLVEAAVVCIIPFLPIDISKVALSLLLWRMLHKRTVVPG